jgi:molybdate transport system permease protein
VFTLTPEELEAIKLSLRVSTLAMAASLPFGIAVAMVLTRTRFYGRMLLNALVLLPLVLPPVVTGYVLLLLFGRQGPIGGFLDERFGIVLGFAGPERPWPAPSWDFAARPRHSALARAVDRRLEQAASRSAPIRSTCSRP